MPNKNKLQHEVTHKNNLQKAQSNLEKSANALKESRFRPKYHFTAPAGWINDPNGLIYYKGKYHIFYQHNPYGTTWSSAHWGHAASCDLLHWEHMPIALAPSEDYDDLELGGCFSGSAIEHDGKLFLMYTGTTGNNSRLIQTQCLAYSEDGVNYEKYENNPVIRCFPQNDATDDFRDPKIFRFGDYFYAAIGTSFESSGRILLYRSADIYNWEYCGVIAESDDGVGRVWECPDLFPLDGKWVLIFSPIDTVGDTRYFVGQMDFESFRFIKETEGVIDYGLDFYAPQTLEDGDGRRIMFGWQDSWQYPQETHPCCQEGWRGNFSLPRVLSIGGDNELLCLPAKELECLRKGYTELISFSVGHELKEIPCGDSECFELDCIIDLAENNAECFEFLLKKSENYESRLILDFKNMAIIFNRNNADNYYYGVKTAPLRLHGSELRVRIFSDRNSIESFIGNGHTVLTFNIYNAESKQRNYLCATGGNAVIKSLKVWSI